MSGAPVRPGLPTAARHRPRLALAASVAALTAAAAALPGAASAANVDRPLGLNRIDVTASAGEVNQIRVSDDGTGFVRIRDAVTLSESTPVCVPLSSVEVRCSVDQSMAILVRPGDRDNRIEVATTLRFGIDGGPGKDTYVGGLASSTDVLFLGGGGVDTASYADAPAGVVVRVGDGPGDGRAFDSDDIVDAENLVGSRLGDRLTAAISGTVAARLDGGAGDDTLTSSGSIDTLTGGPGFDTLSSGANVDRIIANDPDRDTIDCGGGSPDEVVASLIGERSIIACEKLFTASPPPPGGGGLIGTLRLTPAALRVPAGEIAQMRLAWRHPRSWRRLRRITLRLYRKRAPVAAVHIRPRAERMTARGAVKLVRKGSQIRRKDKTVAARLAVRLGRSLAGRRLRVEVEATDVRGGRQLQRNAGSIRVARAGT
jgi:hypothetical protein